MTAWTVQQLIDWGPVRCHDEQGAVEHEGLVIATSADDKVLVRDRRGRQAWFAVGRVCPAGVATAAVEADV